MSTQLYDPANNSWSFAGGLTVCDTTSTPMLLPNGHVVVIAGGSGLSYYTKVTFYDPFSTTWSTGQTINGSFTAQNAALLGDGRVLAVGFDHDNGGAFKAEIYDPNANTWSLAPSFVVGTHYSSFTATTLLDGKVLVAGGSAGNAVSIAEVYDPLSNSWSATWPLANARFSHTATLLKDGSVLASGGCRDDTQSGYITSAEIYPIMVGAWRGAGYMATNRSGASAILLLNGKVLVAGGYSSGGIETASAELYDPASNTWSPAASMPAPRCYYTAARLLDGRVLVAGGNSGYQAQSSALVYDPMADSWLPAGKMTTSRVFASSVFLSDGRVLVIGGADNAYNQLASTELYNPATNKWSPGASLPVTRSGFTATLLLNGKVLVAGGEYNIYLASTLLYDPASNRWSAGPNMATARSIHSATLLRDGRVLVAGGTSYDGFSETILSSAEIYNPLSNSWSPAKKMPRVRTGHSATLMMDGRVLLAGGISGQLNNTFIYVGPADIYDPLTNTWATTPSMLVARDGHQAVLLANSRVLVTGGCGGSCQTYADPEYFDLPVQFAHWVYAPVIVR